MAGKGCRYRHVDPVKWAKAWDRIEKNRVQKDKKQTAHKEKSA
jgi:hypothetical protein